MDGWHATVPDPLRGPLPPTLDLEDIWTILVLLPRKCALLPCKGWAGTAAWTEWPRTARSCNCAKVTALATQCDLAGSIKPRRAWLLG